MNRWIPVTAALLCLAGGTLPASAAGLTFNAPTNGTAADFRADWLAAIGISEPQYLVDFETGFTDGQNLSGTTFAGGLVITDTTPAAAAVIEGTARGIGGSNPVGAFSLEHNEQPYLELDFSAAPMDYVAFRDIDTAGTDVIVTFVGGETETFSLETTATSGNSAEFFGIFNDGMPRIAKLEMDASGDGTWGIDEIEYGTIAAPQRPVPLPSVMLVIVGAGVLTIGSAGRVRR